MKFWSLLGAPLLAARAVVVGVSMLGSTVACFGGERVSRMSRVKQSSESSESSMKQMERWKAQAAGGSRKPEDAVIVLCRTT